MKKIRESKFSKLLAYYFSITIFSQIISPTCAYALTEGPTQPEFSSFTPISTSDMVDLASGDFSYNIPIMDVGGYPINLSYSSGISMDQESSWVGLGWNLNVGQIDRNVRGLPDDFDGDVIETKNNIRDNVTVGAQGYVNPQLVGALDGLKVGGGMSLQYNNYTGYSCTPSYGLSFKLNDNVSVGMQLSSSVESGVSVSPSVSISTNEKNTEGKANKYIGSFSSGINYNSRQGLSSFNMNASLNQIRSFPAKNLKDKDGIDSYTTSSINSNMSYVNTVFSPTKRTRYNNASGTLGFSVGPDVMGGHVELSMSAFASIQSIADKTKFDRSFGYENTENAGIDDILDFSREKEEGQISKNTLVLPVPVYNHDILTIQGQGINGMFRPYRSKVGGLYTGYVKDGSWSFNASGEVEGGAGFHGGGGFKYTDVDSYSGVWNTNVSPYFISENTNKNAIDYEKFYYKIVGERNVDKEYTNFQSKTGTSEPIAVKLDGAGLTNSYLKKDNGFSTFNSEIKRKNRLIKNKNIQKITKKETEKFDLDKKFFFKNDYAKDHHTAGYMVTEDGGNRYIYGNTVYNKEKSEVSFSTNNNLDESNFKKGITAYSDGEVTQTNHAGLDHYFNEIKTPAYATSYLLTSILSNDFSDLTNDGPTDDDLGSYTKFSYEKVNDYKWRIPYTGVSYNAGLNGDKKDQKGSFLYGEKELKYISKIETKTHIAFFELVDRNDALGTIGREGGAGSAKMKYIKSIRLYAKSELINGLDPAETNPNIKPIKTAHFEYDYSLCKGVENHSNPNSAENGKLTLKKVYFTYRGSNLGMYAAYDFNYNSHNPNYNPKSYDIWGNYKKNEVNNLAELETKNTPQDFPYVNQDKAEQDLWSSSWTLRSIKLPSGGIIQVEYESDDYQYVQNQRVMKMMKVIGVANDINTAPSTTLYGGSNEAKFVVVKVDASMQNESNESILKVYTDGLIGKPIFFNFYLNLVGDIKDNVQGYFEMSEAAKIVTINSDKCLYIPMKHVHEEGKEKPGQKSNPISVAGWFFGRKHMNHQVYTGGQFNNNPVNVLNIARSLLSNIGQMVEIFHGANGVLRNKQRAKYFTAEKSWIRLFEPTGAKLGGGCRVKKIELYDNWDQMLGINENNPDLNRYKKKYGQEYNYKLDNGTSSGVATYEPNSSKENPLVQPFYHTVEKLSGQIYQETPFGESFFPAPSVTYSQVAVRSTEPLYDQDNSPGAITTNFIKSGKVVTKHYTSFDFPTLTDNTSLADSNLMRYETNENKFSAMSLAGLLGVNIVNTHSDLTMSQGFSITTNDMNGKVKEQLVFNESNDLISSVKYKYASSTDKPNTLNNNLLVVDEKGDVSKKVIGETTEVYNDFNTSNSKSTTTGGNVNVDVIPLVIVPLVIGFAVPERSVHRQTLKTVTTAKVIHKTGILVETIATDLGSTVSTKNLAWDANTGNVLLTQTINEFDDSYYSFNYPAYWHYSNMAASSKNTDILLKINNTPEIENDKHYFSLSNLTIGNNLHDIVTVGDQIYNVSTGDKYWIFGFNNAGNKFCLMDDYGNKVPTIGTLPNQIFKIVFSGFKNLQTDMMASITMMKNPLILTSGNSQGFINQDLIEYYQNEQNNGGIINASAIEYSNNWKSVCENNLPNKNNLIPSVSIPVNPYKYNLLGIWRPIKSYAYLTGRTNSSESRIRKTGYFTSFNPFYKYENNKWSMNKANWTFASEVTRYLPHGVEIENKDALNRFSSAQYGYGYKLPMAVTSNSQYKEMGFDGFEDYNLENYSTASTLIPHFGFSNAVSSNNPITNEKSHTGKNSIKVSSGSNVQIKRKIGECGTNNSSY